MVFCKLAPFLFILLVLTAGGGGTAEYQMEHFVHEHF